MLVRILCVIVTLLLSVILSGCMSDSDYLGIAPNKWQEMNNDQQQQIWVNHDKIERVPFPFKITYDGPDIVVSLSGGKAMMPPFMQAYRYVKTEFTLTPGKCTYAKIDSKQNSNSVSLKVCYNGLVLLIDPSRYDLNKSRGTLRLTYNPVWKRGFTYRDMSTDGYVRLSNVNIYIKVIPKIAPVKNVDNSST